MAKRSSSTRELIDTGRNKVVAKRDARAQFKEIDDVGPSVAADRRRKAKTTVKAGHGGPGRSSASSGEEAVSTLSMSGTGNR